MEHRPHLLPTEPLRLAGTFWLAVSGWRQVMAVARPATNLFNVYPEPGVVNDPCRMVACRPVGATLTVCV